VLRLVLNLWLTLSVYKAFNDEVRTMMRRTRWRRLYSSLQLLLAGSICYGNCSALAAPVGGILVDPLNFGQMIIGSSGGDLAMDVSTGVRTGSGGVTPFSGGISPTRLRADLTADAGVLVTIGLPPSVNLTGTTYGSVISWFPTLNTPTTFTMPGSGNFILYMAGTLAIPFGVSPDSYVGSVTVAFDYTF
jgi:Domain of unknown function (DUF4402)